jgi:hypothetical protein
MDSADQTVTNQARSAGDSESLACGQDPGSHFVRIPEQA